MIKHLTSTQISQSVTHFSNTQVCSSNTQHQRQHFGDPHCQFPLAASSHLASASVHSFHFVFFFFIGQIKSVSDLPFPSFHLQSLKYPCQGKAFLKSIIAPPFPRPILWSLCPFLLCLSHRATVSLGTPASSSCQLRHRITDWHAIRVRLTRWPALVMSFPSHWSKSQSHSSPEFPN